jgi:uncharacterized Zn-finger protein
MGIIRITKAQRRKAAEFKSSTMADDPNQSESGKSEPGPDIVHTSQIEVKCDGDGGALGHPRVFLHMENGQVECPYCDRLFILQSDTD